MTVGLEDFLADLPPGEPPAVAESTPGGATLRQLREARRQSQEELAAKLGVGQPSIAKLEKRSDLYVRTLRRYVEALGGSLEIHARFPGRPPVRITQFADE